MSTSSPDQVPNDNGDVKHVLGTAKQLLASLSDLTASIPTEKIEQKKFLEIGSYFYRTSSALSELQTSENSLGDETEILQSLYQTGSLARSILEKLQQNGSAILDHEAKSMIKQLEEIINHMGHDLSLIPTSAFRDEEIAKITIRSLSEEMKKVHFEVNLVQETKDNNQKTSPSILEAEHQNAEMIPIESDLYDISKEISAENSHMDDVQQLREALKTDPSDLEAEHQNAVSIPIPADLYSISMEVSTENSHMFDIPHLMEALRSTSDSSQRTTQGRTINETRLSRSVTEAAQHMEPMYKSFICPLTDEIMDDPVTISSGVTYERRAIIEYFETLGDSEVRCPITREKLESKAMNPNIALRNIVREWKDRNDSAQLKVIRAALSIGSTESMIHEALQDLKNICQRNPMKMKEVRSIGIMPLLVRLLELRDRAVRCGALEMIKSLVQEEEAKEQIAKTPAVSMTIKLLSSSYQPIRHAALLLLIEFSKSKFLSEKIGQVTGGILILIQTKFNRSLDAFASEAADQVLSNMEQSPNNIKLMAENGYLEPLLNNLIQGSQEMKLEMITYLGEITLEDDTKTYVAERTSPVLIQMLHNGNPFTKKTVFKALVQISSYSASGRILVEAGIVGTMVEEMFTKKIYSEPVDSLKEASAIIANVLESGIGFENLKVNSQGHTMVSGYVVFNIIYMIKNSTPDDLILNLIRILYCMAKTKKSDNPVISAVKESEASYTLVELINTTRDDIAIAAIKLLTLLTPHIGHLLIDRLCKTSGQPEGLVQSTSDPLLITERQALSVSFLAKLPHQNLTLNIALLTKNTIPVILQSIHQLQRSGTRLNRYAGMYVEGLVGVLVRFTATLYDSQMLFMAVNHNFTAVLTELLTEASRDEVQTLAATALEKLSTQSTRLSKPPQKTQKKVFNLFYLPRWLTIFKSSKKTQVQLCVAHKGVCSGQNTFCLIEAGAIERLLACLDHQNVQVAEAALSALSTLVDEKVDVEQSVKMLDEMNVTQRVLKAVRYHKNETLWQKAFWMIERFLLKGGQRSLALVSQDKLFYITVVTAFHHGDAYTRQMAENILRYLDKMPSLTGTFTM